MFRFFYLTIFCFISLGLLYYLVAIALSPYGSENALEVKNLIIVDFVAIITLGSILGLLHSLIDKLFFLKFYQKPRMFLGLRRGLLFSITAVLVLNMRLFGFIEWYYFTLVGILAILIEILLSSIKRKEKVENSVEK